MSIDPNAMSDDVITTRMNEAALLGDIHTVAVCHRALSGCVPYRVYAALTAASREVVGAMCQRSARRPCARMASDGTHVEA